MVKLELSLKRVQTFIFEVPRLKAMLGANALIGQTLRSELSELLDGRGAALSWPPGLAQPSVNDPLDGAAAYPADRDDPAALYKQGILARDGGHFIVLFEDEPAAEDFLARAEELLAERLPGVLYDARITPFPEPKHRQRSPRTPNETVVLDLPVLQVCQETGQGPASAMETREAVTRWQAQSVRHRLQRGAQFYAGQTRDIIGLLRPVLYPDHAMDWQEPIDLAELAAGGYLALIHADGNGIGRRYKHWRAQMAPDDPVAQEARGEAFFHSMRVVVRHAVMKALRRSFTAHGGIRPYEVLMLGGDDLLLICRANRALDFARAYAEELSQAMLADGDPLTVAIGVAIAQKGYPLHRLHDLAESLATSAKRLYRALPVTERASVIDWQVVTQSWFEGVAEARRQSELVDYRVNGKPETLLLTGRPYPVLGTNGLDGLLTAVAGLDEGGQSDDTAREVAARSPLRGLRTACEQGRLLGEMAFARLPQRVRSRLAWEDGSLWKPIAVHDGTAYLNRALDIIGLREVSRLGKKNHD